MGPHPPHQARATHGQTPMLLPTRTNDVGWLGMTAYSWYFPLNLDRLPMDVSRLGGHIRQLFARFAIEPSDLDVAQPWAPP